MDKIKVLYIAGWGRSGSTLFSSILGSVPGFFAGGELAFFWGAARLHDWHCSCREPLVSCPVWRDVLTRAFGRNAFDPAFIAAMHEGVMALLNKHRHGTAVFGRQLKRGPSETETLRNIDRFYQSIHTTTGARVIIDSSKVPLYAKWLNELPGLDVYLLHLVRDPRAVCYSWSRAKPNMSGTGQFAIPRRSTLQSALRWIGVNQIFHGMRSQHPGRYLQIRYTDFLADPQPVIEKIFAFIGETNAPSPIHEHGTAVLAPQHLAFGNPDRMQQGTISLSIRNEWRQKMPLQDKWLVTLLCAPWMIRYRYPFRATIKQPPEGPGNASRSLPATMLLGATGAKDLLYAGLANLFSGRREPA